MYLNVLEATRIEKISMSGKNGTKSYVHASGACQIQSSVRYAHHKNESMKQMS